MTTKTWGIRFNARPEFQRLQKGELPQGCPNWFTSRHIGIWQEQGLIVWSDSGEKIEKLNGHDAMRLLDQLSSQVDWKSEGVSIAQLVTEFSLERSSRGRRHKNEQEPIDNKEKNRTYYKEMIHLPPDAGLELLDLLQANKERITKMVDEEKERFDEARSQVWELMLEFNRKEEQKKIDFQSRPFGWHSLEPNRWSCQHQSAEGRVILQKNKLHWETCVRRPGFAGKSNYFLKLEEAVEWVEKELIELANQPDEEGQLRIRTEQQREANRVRLHHKLLNGPFWVDPALLEPKRVIYKILIELDANPVTYKTMETMCGDTLQYDKHYPSPIKLAETLKLDFDRFNVEQLAGENSEWYIISSLTVYYQETAAAEQSQKTWDQGQFIQQFKAGKIRRVRYGYREVETGYTVFLGACERQEDAWEQPCSREDHLAAQALHESLSFALDINDYSDYLGLNSETITDVKILQIMHSARSRSKYLSDEIRRESKIWLAQHEPLM
jgi:hypothetical protein